MSFHVSYKRQAEEVLRQMHRDRAKQDATMSQGMPTPAEVWRGRKQILPQNHQRECSPLSTLTLDFSSPEPWDINLSCFQPRSLRKCVTVATGNFIIYQGALEELHFFLSSGQEMENEAQEKSLNWDLQGVVDDPYGHWRFRLTDESELSLDVRWK